MVTVPARVRDELKLSAGMVMDVSVEDGQLMMRPARAERRKYSLAELLAEEAKAGIMPLDGVDQDWVNATPEGREIW
jgi:antitoxin component of MazEF toxin-antitoxin module